MIITTNLRYYPTLIYKEVTCVILPLVFDLGVFMNDKNLTVYKSNVIIEAGYKLTLNEQRVVLACIGKVDPRKELLATDKLELSAKSLIDIFGVSEKNAYSALVEVTDTLFNRYLVIENPFPDDKSVTSLKTRWISSILYKKEQGKIAITFAPDLLPYLSQLKGCFTKYELNNVGNMTSIYGFRLYELLMQWRTTGKREVEIEWLKKQFELDESYSRIDNLKKRVIEPAVKDINTHSNFTVAWEQRKTGRTVTHLIFTFAEKQPEPTQEATAKPKAKGKMINGVVESEINAKARKGESTQAAAERIKREKLANVEKLQGKKEKPAAKPQEVWERNGFKSQKEYDVFMFNQQMEKYKDK